MTVSTTTIRSGPYPGNDVADTFNYNFTVTDKSEMTVYETTAGVTTTLVVDVDYTVNGVGTAGGSTITRIAGPLASGTDWLIFSNYSEKQLTAFASQGGFFPAVHEAAFDRLTYLVQQIFEKLNRTLRLSPVDGVDGSPALDADAATRAMKYLAFDGNGDIDIVSDPSILPSTSEINLSGTVAAMKVKSLNTGVTAETQGYATSDDDGGARYLVQTANQFDGTPDEVRDHTLANGNVATLQPSGVVNFNAFGADIQNTPFGKTGLRLVAGEKRDAHYAWGSIVEIPDSNKWLMIYRKGTEHGTENNAQIRAADSYDYGLSWVNDRQVQIDATTDSRPDKITIMANGRIGFFCNRASTGTNKYPLFISSDDDGATWNKLEVPTSSLTYTFSAVGGIIDFPASQGGDDDTGFVTFGYIDATGVDAFTTIDNGDSWQTVSNVSGAVVVSENVILRIGTSDRWLIYVRATPDLLVYSTTNLLSWGTSQNAGLESLSTPPGGFYDKVTDKVYCIATARAGKEVDGYGNNLLYVSEDAETLWLAGGVFTTEYKSLITAPNWTTGYFYTFDSRLGRCAVFTAGENVANGEPPSSIWLVGNFDTTGFDVGMFVDKFTRNMDAVNSIHLKAVDNLTNTYPAIISNKSESISNYYGPYATSYNLGGATYSILWNDGDHIETFNSDMGNVEYDFNNTGTIRFNGVNLLFGSSTTEKINGDDATIHAIINSSTSPSIRSIALGTASSRKHLVLHHDTGSDIGVAAEVGSISTTSTATAFNTSSDETLKDFIGEYSADKAIEIIKADPVREFNWKSTGELAIGWGAQTSYEISNDLASKGGWFLDDVEVSPDTKGAVYVPWGIDQSKRTPYLWSAVSNLIERLENAEQRIKELENANVTK